MIFYLLAILLSEIFVANCNHTKEEEECVIRLLGECSTKYKINSQFYPSDDNQLEQYCRSIEENERCFKNTWNQCIPAGPQREAFISEMNKFSSPHYKDLCNTGSVYSRLFKKYGKCLSQTILDQKKCHNKYRILTKPKAELLRAIGHNRNNSREDNRQKIRQICCWWNEYQSCTVKAVRDKCGEQSAHLINDEFFKSFTSSATSKILTYKSCLSQDNTTRFTSCFIDQSVEPKAFGINTDNDNELDVEEESRRKQVVDQFGPQSNLDSNVFNQIEASTHSSVESVNHRTRYYILLTILIIKLINIS